MRKVKAICTGFSVLAFQCVEFSFGGKTKLQMLTTSCRIVTLAIHDLSISFGLYKSFFHKLQRRQSQFSIHRVTDLGPSRVQPRGGGAGGADGQPRDGGTGGVAPFA